MPAPRSRSSHLQNKPISFINSPVSGCSSSPPRDCSEKLLPNSRCISALGLLRRTWDHFLLNMWLNSSGAPDPQELCLAAATLRLRRSSGWAMCLSGFAWGPLRQGEGTKAENEWPQMCTSRTRLNYRGRGGEGLTGEAGTLNPASQGYCEIRSNPMTLFYPRQAPADVCCAQCISQMSLFVSFPISPISLWADKDSPHPPARYRAHPGACA